MVEAKKLITQLDRHDDVGSGRSGVILLDKNERTTPYPESVVTDIFETITPTDLTRYPDQSLLYEKLVEFLKLDRGQLLLSNGADNGLKIIFDTYISSGDEILFFDPTYAMISVYSQMYGCKQHAIPFGPDLALNPGALLSSISTSTKCVIIPNPNQPTGTILDAQSIKTLLHRTAECDTLLVLDEAYVEFSGEKSAVELIRDHPNLCVLRTFSKAWGLAGARLGFIVAPATMIQQMKKVKTLLDINVFAIRAASYLIDHYHLVESYVEDVVQSRDSMILELRLNDIEVISSNTNFIHIRPPSGTNLRDIENALIEKGYRFRSAGGGATILDGCLRLTIGPEKQMKPLLDELLRNIKRLRAPDHESRVSSSV